MQCLCRLYQIKIFQLWRYAGYEQSWKMSMAWEAPHWPLAHRHLVQLPTMQLQGRNIGNARVSTTTCAVSQSAPRCRVVRRAAAVEADVGQKKQQLIDVMKTAAKAPGSVPAAALLAGMVELEKLKLKPEGDEWSKTVSGKWRLIYTAGDSDVQAAQKGTKGGSGTYFPLTAAQNYDLSAATFENGVFFGPVAHLTFKGPYKWNGRQLQFDVNGMFLGLGPWRVPIQLKQPTAIEQMDTKDQKALPFFIFAYVDEEVMVARGRSGGLALWAKPDSQWCAKSGVLQVYK